MLFIRFKLSVWLYWLWIKVTPEGPVKSAIIDATYLSLRPLATPDPGK